MDIDDRLLDGLRRYPTLQSFVLGAIDKLDRHNHKTSWRDLPLEALFRKLEIEVQELAVSLKYETPQEAQSECQDCLNFAFFLHDRLGQ